MHKQYLAKHKPVRLLPMLLAAVKLPQMLQSVTLFKMQQDSVLLLAVVD
tara:strand:- start:270 stop:416 length:147 start_codon:yes stop_codon:yes gene_type:complete